MGTAATTSSTECCFKNTVDTEINRAVRPKVILQPLVPKYHDVYIQDCERAQDISYISSLEYSMIIDFTERVARNKIPRGMSQEIFECIQFITQHINDPIQVGDVAEHIGKSRSYLCEKFKKELGFDVSRFIMRCKLEEAKSLLTYSNKPLSEISNYLCFSSQSYFQNVFKKKYGLTPKQYRDRTKQLS